MANIYNMIDTWNDGATTFTAIKMNVTDTASSSSSLLMDLQVGGSRKFSVSKSGGVVMAGGDLVDGTNAQTFNLYNTYTDASNYERGFMRFVSNVLQIGTEAAGTGVNRKVTIKGGNTVQLQLETDITYTRSYLGFGNTAGTATASLRSDVAGVLRLAGGITTATGAAHELIEMTAPAAPAADRVRIYAEDNGSGKTRLMALFPTGAAQQIAIEP